MTTVDVCGTGPAVPTIEDAAHYLRTDTATITRWFETPQLPGSRHPDRWPISTDELADQLSAFQPVAEPRGEEGRCGCTTGLVRGFSVSILGIIIGCLNYGRPDDGRAIPQ